MAKERLKQIIRLAETDLDGGKEVVRAIQKVKGVSFMFANAVVQAGGFLGKRLSELKEEELKKLEDIIYHPEKYGIPEWLLNRRRDPRTGKTFHLIGSQLEITQKFDINELKKMKCYRGIRHSLGLPVRGQRTRSSFRKGKTVGVVRKKQQPGRSK